LAVTRVVIWCAPERRSCTWDVSISASLGLSLRSLRLRAFDRPAAPSFPEQAATINEDNSFNWPRYRHMIAVSPRVKGELFSTELPKSPAKPAWNSRNLPSDP